MKKFLTIIALVFGTTTIQAQIEQYDFQYKDGGLIWQKVYSDSVVTVDQIIKAISANSWVRTPHVRNDVVFAEMTDFQLDFKRFGKSHATTPFIYRNGKWRGSITIDIKPGKYRVTISSMMIDAGTMDTGFGLEQVSSSGENLFLNKPRTKFRNEEWLILYGTQFSNAFLIDHTDKKEDW
jgi:hypothetical protein